MSLRVKPEVYHSSPYLHSLFPLSPILCEIIQQIQAEFADHFGVPEIAAHRK